MWVLPVWAREGVDACLDGLSKFFYGNFNLQRVKTLARVA